MASRISKSLSFIPASHSLKVLDELALQDSRLEAVKQVVDIVSKQRARVLMVMPRDPGRNMLLGVATKYPGLFRLHDEDDLGPNTVAYTPGTKYIDFTPEMEKLCRDETRVAQSRDERLSVNILRKLLMMSTDKEISLTKLSWLATDFGLPACFDSDLVIRYPSFFGVRESTRGPLLTLQAWDQELTMTSREKTLLFNRFFPKTGFKLVQDRWRPEDYEQFQRLEFPSPYEPWERPDWNTKSLVAEKRHIGVLHEELSLLPKKRAALTTLELLREELSLPKMFQRYLVKHPSIFYVSGAVEPPMVFLREAFFQNELKFKGPEDFIRDRYLILMQRRGRSDQSQTLEEA